MRLFYQGDVAIVRIFPMLAPNDGSQTRENEPHQQSFVLRRLQFFHLNDDVSFGKFVKVYGLAAIQNRALDALRQIGEACKQRSAVLAAQTISKPLPFDHLLHLIQQVIKIRYDIILIGVFVSLLIVRLLSAFHILIAGDIPSSLFITSIKSFFQNLRHRSFHGKRRGKGCLQHVDMCACQFARNKFKRVQTKWRDLFISHGENDYVFEIFMFEQDAVLRLCRFQYKKRHWRFTQKPVTSRRFPAAGHTGDKQMLIQYASFYAYRHILQDASFLHQIAQSDFSCLTHIVQPEIYTFGHHDARNFLLRQPCDQTNLIGCQAGVQPQQIRFKGAAHKGKQLT